MEDLKLTKDVKASKSLFEKVADNHEQPIKVKDDTRYTVLNYEKMIHDMTEYLEGYRSYKTNGDNKYEGKVIGVSNSFYDGMFKDEKKYRKVIYLRDYQNMVGKFLEETKKLQDVLDEMRSDKEAPSEVKQLVRLTDNQYHKIAKVQKDDMQIYLWLITQNSKVYRFPINSSVRDNFNNKNTPVMHRLKKKVSNEK